MELWVLLHKEMFLAILIEGLKRLEYRGYDSAGLAVISNQEVLNSARQVGKVIASLLQHVSTDTSPWWNRHCAYPLGNARGRDSRKCTPSP